MTHWMRGTSSILRRKPVSELRYNIYGFNVGGPVTFGKLYNPSKTKTFFFYNMEWRKIINGGNPINQQVPDPDTYGGDFRTICHGQTLTIKQPSFRTRLHVPCLNQFPPQQVAAFNTPVSPHSAPGRRGDCAVQGA